jgi:NTP pyrophosphatase (non-canonical NTP hydrolase)
VDLSKLVELQLELDERHGFAVKFESIGEKYTQISKDLVGLFGEIGEFSNIIKKINIHLDRPGVYDFDIPAGEKMLAEELVDTLIYVLRIGAILRIDIEREMINKIKKNEVKYSRMINE